MHAEFSEMLEILNAERFAIAGMILDGHSKVVDNDAVRSVNVIRDKFPGRTRKRAC